ncbi:hypothetical protein VNO78_24796 [Psophocarpus tetragonolobus]|uniref:Uncharacterized protein n=1 Tax=Psophocarpus tetragonolobus TaxID=3891 RepID=A0AAN9S642_PSOTE
MSVKFAAKAPKHQVILSSVSNCTYNTRLYAFVLSHRKEALRVCQTASYANAVKKPNGFVRRKIKSVGRTSKVSSFNFYHKSDAKEVTKMAKAHVGKVKKKGSSYGTTHKLHQEGIFGIRATPMEVNMVLLEMDNAKDVKEYINGNVDWSTIGSLKLFNGNLP